MSLDLDALSNYVKENEQQLTAQAIFSGKTASLIEAKGNVQVGIKSSETINIMTTDAVFQTGGTCGFTPSGTTTITQRPLVVGKIKVQEAICPKDFEAKYTQKALRQGSTYDYMVYATEYSKQKTDRIAAALETALWNGDISGGNSQLNKFDGILKQLADGGVPNNTFDFTDPIGAVDYVYNNLNPAILDRDDLVIFCGSDFFRSYTTALRQQNLYHYPVDSMGMELIVPGTNVKLIGVNGLNGNSWYSDVPVIVGISMANLYLGTDLLNEQEKFELFFAKEADEMRFVVEFKMGVQVAFPAEAYVLVSNI